MYIGVNFAGPLYVKDRELVSEKTVWIYLYTCCVVRAVHLDQVPNLTADTSLGCFRGFTSSRGFSSRIVSDNGKTQAMLTQPDVKQHSSMVCL